MKRNNVVVQDIASFIGLAVMITVGFVIMDSSMVISAEPNWIGSLICDSNYSVIKVADIAKDVPLNSYPVINDELIAMR